MRMLSFLNNGPEQLPGLIVMRLQDLDNIDPKFSEIVVLVNADHKAVTFSDTVLAGKEFVLHPVQQNSNDRVLRSAAYTAASGTFTVPAITTAVFVVERPYTPPPAVVPQVKHKFDKPIAVAIGSLFLLLVAGLIYLVVRRFTRKGK